MIIQVPITPANLRFLRVKYQFGEVYKLSRQHATDFVLIALLEPKPGVWAPIPVNGLPLLSIELYKGDGFHYRIHLTSETITAFNHFIDELIKAEFISHMQALVEIAGFDVNESVYHFIEKFTFEDTEITFEALRKYYSRSKAKQESRAITIK